MGLQKEHDIADLFLVLPGHAEHGDAFFADAADTGQPFGLVLDDVQRLLAEFFIDARRMRGDGPTPQSFSGFHRGQGT